MSSTKGICQELPLEAETPWDAALAPSGSATEQQLLPKAEQQGQLSIIPTRLPRPPGSTIWSSAAPPGCRQLQIQAGILGAAEPQPHLQERLAAGAGEVWAN